MEESKETGEEDFLGNKVLIAKTNADNSIVEVSKVELTTYCRGKWRKNS